MTSGERAVKVVDTPTLNNRSQSIEKLSGRLTSFTIITPLRLFPIDGSAIYGYLEKPDGELLIILSVCIFSVHEENVVSPHLPFPSDKRSV